MGRSWSPPEGKRGSSGQVKPFWQFVPSPFDRFFCIQCRDTFGERPEVDWSDSNWRQAAGRVTIMYYSTEMKKDKTANQRLSSEECHGITAQQAQAGILPFPFSTKQGFASLKNYSFPLLDIGAKLHLLGCNGPEPNYICYHWEQIKSLRRFFKRYCSQGSWHNCQPAGCGDPRVGADWRQAGDRHQHRQELQDDHLQDGSSHQVGKIFFTSTLR